jgi:hypothetical protein
MQDTCYILQYRLFRFGGSRRLRDLYHHPLFKDRRPKLLCCLGEHYILRAVCLNLTFLKWSKCTSIFHVCAVLWLSTYFTLTVQYKLYFKMPLEISSNVHEVFQMINYSRGNRTTHWRVRWHNLEHA